VITKKFSCIFACWFLSGTLSLSWAVESNQSADYSDKPESFFPELSKVLTKLNEDAPFLLEQRELIRQAHSERIIADSSKGFKLGISAQAHSLHEDRPTQGFYHSYRTMASIHLKKPLYHWGALDAASRISQLSEESSKTRYSSLQRSYRSKIRSDYLELMILGYEQDLAQESLALARENEQDLIKRRDLGKIPDLTVYESTLARLKQSVKLSDLRRKSNYQARVFQMETGYSGKLTFAKTLGFTDFCEKHAFSGSVPVLVSQLSSPELAYLKNEIEMERNKIKIADADLKPKLNLIGALYQDQVDMANSRETLKRNNLLVGIEAQWAIWDSSRSKGRKEAARSRKRMNEISLERSAKALRLMVEDLRNQISSLSEEIDANRQLVKVAGNRYEKSILEFQQNRITPTLHFEARLTLDQSKLDLAKTVSQYLQARDFYDERTTFQHKLSWNR
jgi:outer membrane protein TolC